MNIDVIPYASAIRDDLTENKSVVVIDVLRASSVIVTALFNGAQSVVPVKTVDAAFDTADNKRSNCLLAGERDTRKPDGFHLGNSPLDYKKEIVSGKTIVLTTSNGTKALNRINNAKEIFIGSFLNVDAVVKKLNGKEQVALVCSGTNNTFSMDDAMCAAMITDKLMINNEVQLSDFTLTILKAYNTGKGNLRELLNDCYHLNLLIRNGFAKDVEYCLQTNKYQVVPKVVNGEIIL